VSKISLFDHFETAPFSHGNRNNTLDFDFYHPMPLSKIIFKMIVGLWSKIINFLGGTFWVVGDLISVVQAW
jgi:hypothetical protein